jgi:hypothetical protein
LACPQISHEFERFSSYLPDVNVMVIYGGVPIKEHKDLLKSKPPHVVVGTPGRIKAVRTPPGQLPPARSTAARPDAPALRAACHSSPRTAT